MKASEKKVRLYVKGMTCINCSNKIEKALSSTTGVIGASVSYSKGTADIEYDGKIISLEEIVSVIEEIDYEVHSYDFLTSEKVTDSGNNPAKVQGQAGADPVRTILILVIVAALYIMLQHTGILNLLVPGRLAESSMSYGMIFVIGLITSVHCIAMCGGINISQSLTQTGGFHALAYNGGRVLAYTVIGFVLGTVGFLFGGGADTGISLLLQGALKIIAGILMAVMGINMLGIFPVFRKIIIPVPKIFSGAAKGGNGTYLRRPFMVGILNGFMPCGPLQSMWLVALAAGNPIAGALSMLSFSLGTVPLMLGLGSIVSILGKKFKNSVMTVGAILVVVLGLAMLSQGFALSGMMPSKLLPAEEKPPETAVQLVDGVQVINSTLQPGNYPSISVQAGMPVKWIINAPEGSINGCNYKMIIHDLNIEHTFSTGENIIEFTPQETGKMSYSCWMGMIHGSIFVTGPKEDTDLKEQQGQQEQQEQQSEVSAFVVTQSQPLVIDGSKVTSDVSFFPVVVDDTELEIIAVRDSDGNIRTAFNTCQICYSSGRGYYVQQGSDLVCQNCGNRFTVDQVEVEAGGCNPWPIFAENKTVSGDQIEISYDFLAQCEALFANWKTAY